MTIKQGISDCMLAACLMVINTNMVAGQTFPSKPVRIVTAEPGGGSDFSARLIAQGLAGSLNQQVIIENRGGSVLIPADIVSKAPPDGYTMLANGCSVWIGQLLLSGKKPNDTLKDFLPITIATSSPSVLVVHPSFPVKSVTELIALAKGKPGNLNYSSGPIGSSAHNAAELFKAMTGIDIVQINYKGTAQALNGVVSGETQLMFANAAGASPLINSGRLKAMAVASAAPSSLFPGVPTVSASGGPSGYESGSTLGIFATAKTPKAIITRLNQDIVRALHTNDVKLKFLNAGVEPVGSSPEELAAFMTSEVVRMGKIIKDAKLGENK